MRPGTRCVLGIQDLKGAPVRLGDSVAYGGLFETVERLYDELWIYGSREVFDTVREYGFPPALARKSHYCGYLQRRKVPSRSRGGVPRVLIVADDDVTGSRIVETYLDGLRWLGNRLALRTTVCFDVQVSSELRNDLLRRFGHLADVEFQDTVAHPERLYAQSDVVISTARYGNVCDILSFGHRAVLVPRAEPDWEQLIRAQRLESLSMFEVIELHALSPEVLIGKMLDALESGRRPRGVIDLGGLPHISERARAMLASPSWEGGLVETGLAES
jgi:predicted glycosyltransferase